MPFDPNLPTVRDRIRWMLGDTDDAAPLLGLAEAGWDQQIQTLGPTQAYVQAARRLIITLGNKWTDGDVSEDPTPQIKALEQGIEDVLAGRVVLSAGGIDAGGSQVMATPDLETYNDLAWQLPTH